MYSLFNTTDRGPMKNIYMCNVRKPYCSSRAVVTHDGSTYVIERQTTKSTNKKGVVSASTALNLFKMRDDGELDDLCGEQRSDTEKTLRRLIGTSDDFLLTSLSAQGDTNSFISQGSSKRRAILSRFLDLEVFDRMYDLANKDLNGLKAQLRNFPERNWEEEGSTLTESLRVTDEQIDTLTDDIEDARTKLSLLKTEMAGHNARPVTQDDLDAQVTRVESLERKSTECREKISTLEGEVTDLNEKLTALDAAASKYDVDVLRTRLESQRKLERSVVELRHALDKEETLLTSQKKSLKILDEVPCGDDFPTCKFIKDAHVTKSKITEQEGRTSRAVSALRDAEDALAGVRDDTIEEKLNKHAKTQELSSKIRLEVSRKETEIERLRSSCDSCGTSLEEARRQLVVIREALDNSENEEIVRLRTKVEEMNRDIKAWDRSRIEAIDVRGKLKAKRERLTEDKASRDSLLSQMRIQELVTLAFSKKGVPLVIAKTQLPLINTEVAKILQGIVDFTIELENDEESDALEIYINYGDSRRVVELCSGMEKTVASLALRVAMANVSSLPKPDIFIVDEGFGTLDAAGVEACNRLLTSLKRHFRTVVVITHVDGIKDCADHIIEITKREKDSQVVYS
jgi:exonuclease SbcC